MVDVLKFFVADGVTPFTIAAAVLCGLMLVEGIGIVFTGSGLSHIADAILPDHDHGAPMPGFAEQLLGWLHWGRVPFMALLAMFLAGFAVAGWTVQWLVKGTSGSVLPALLAAIPAVGGGLFFVRKLAVPVMRWLPGDETTAISTEQMVGLKGTVTIAAGADSPGEARVSDQFGQAHYLRIVPVDAAHAFNPGDRIAIVKRSGDLYAAAPPDQYVDVISRNEILSLLEDVAKRPAGAATSADQGRKQ